MKDAACRGLEPASFSWVAARKNSKARRFRTIVRNNRIVLDQAEKVE